MLYRVVYHVEFVEVCLANVSCLGDGCVATYSSQLFQSRTSFRCVIDEKPPQMIFLILAGVSFINDPLLNLHIVLNDLVLFDMSVQCWEINLID